MGFFLVVGGLLVVWFAKLFVAAKQAKDVVAIASNSANGSPTPTPEPQNDQDFAKAKATEWLNARFSPADAEGYRCTFSRNKDGESFIILLENPVASVVGSNTTKIEYKNTGVTWSGSVTIFAQLAQYFYYIVKKDESGKETVVQDHTKYEDFSTNNLLGRVTKKDNQYEVSGFHPFSIFVPNTDSRSTGDPNDFVPVPCNQAEAYLRNKSPIIKSNTNSNTAANASNTVPNYPVTQDRPAANANVPQPPPMTDEKNEFIDDISTMGRLMGRWRGVVKFKEINKDGLTFWNFDGDGRCSGNVVFEGNSTEDFKFNCTWDVEDMTLNVSFTNSTSKGGYGKGSFHDKIIQSEQNVFAIKDREGRIEKYYRL